MVDRVEMQTAAADETNKGGGGGDGTVVVDPPVMDSPLRSNCSVSTPPQETGGEPAPVGGVVVEPCGMTMSPSSKPKTPAADACAGTEEAVVPRPVPLSINEQQPSPPTPTPPTPTKKHPSTKNENGGRSRPHPPMYSPPSSSSSSRLLATVCSSSLQYVFAAEDIVVGLPSILLCIRRLW